MIMPVCIPPYPRELLYGWILRLTKTNHYPSIESFCERYLGMTDKDSYEPSKMSVRLDYRLNLDNLCKQYDKILCFPDVVTVLKTMTPYFAYAPFWTYGYQAKKSQMILREQTRDVLNINSMASDIKELRVCPECIKKDKEKYGEAYLHVEHHLCGVTRCAKHHRPLMRVKISSNFEDEKNWEWNQEVIEARYSVEIQEKQAGFASGLFWNPLRISLAETQALLLSKLRERGYPIRFPYGTFVDDFRENGWTAEKTMTDKGIYFILNEEKVVLQSILNMVCFLFENYNELKYAAEKYENLPLFESTECDGDYKLLSQANGFLKLRCNLCQNEFYIHPYALKIGHICPECEKRKSDEENINRMLLHLGDGKYRLSGFESGKQVKVLHTVCGQERSCNIQEVVYGERECICTAKLSIQEIQNRIGNDFKVMEVIREKNYNRIMLQHKNCGHIFSVSLGGFLKRPVCRKCDSEHSPEMCFKEKMKRLTGDEYELVSSYRNSKDIVKIRHSLCGTITSMKAESFLYGSRCDLCTKPIYKEDMEGLLEAYAGKGYHITKMHGHKISIQKPDGQECEGKMTYFIQELSRPTESEIFKERKQILIPEISDRGSFYIEAKKYCEKYQVWIPDFRPSEAGYSKRKSIAKKLVNTGYLYRVMDGVYSLNPDIEDEIIIRQKYLERQGERIGVYYGETLAYHCGILKDKPKETYILCNNGSQNFVNGKVKNTSVRIKKAYVPITNSNYHIIEGLNLLLFLVNHCKYKEAVEDYLIRNGIFKDQLEPFIYQYPESILKIWNRLFLK